MNFMLKFFKRFFSFFIYYYRISYIIILRKYSNWVLKVTKSTYNYQLHYCLKYPKFKNYINVFFMYIKSFQKYFILRIRYFIVSCFSYTNTWKGFWKKIHLSLKTPVVSDDIMEKWYLLNTLLVICSSLHYIFPDICIYLELKTVFWLDNLIFDYTIAQFCYCAWRFFLKKKMDYVLHNHFLECFLFIPYILFRLDFIPEADLLYCILWSSSILIVIRVLVLERFFNYTPSYFIIVIENCILVSSCFYIIIHFFFFSIFNITTVHFFFFKMSQIYFLDNLFFFIKLFFLGILVDKLCSFLELSDIEYKQNTFPSVVSFCLMLSVITFFNSVVLHILFITCYYYLIRYFFILTRNYSMNLIFFLLINFVLTYWVLMPWFNSLVMSINFFDSSTLNFVHIFLTFIIFTQLTVSKIWFYSNNLKISDYPKYYYLNSISLYVFSILYFFSFEYGYNHIFYIFFMVLFSVIVEDIFYYYVISRKITFEVISVYNLLLFIFIIYFLDKYWIVFYNVNSIFYLEVLWITISFILFFFLHLLHIRKNPKYNVSTFITALLITLCTVYFLFLLVTDLSIVNEYSWFSKTEESIQFELLFTFIYVMYLLITKKYTFSNQISNPEVFLLHCVFFISLTTLITTSNIFMFFILIELVGFCTLSYSAVVRRYVPGIESSIKYYIMNTLSSILLLISLSMLWYYTGSFDFESILSFIDYRNSNTSNYTDSNVILYLSLFFILVSFLLKLYVAPLHNWILDVYEGAPLSVSCFYSTVYSPSISFIFGIKIIPLFVTVNHIWVLFSSILIIVGFTTMFIGSSLASSQLRIRKFIACNSISISGFFFIAIALNDEHLLLSSYFLFFSYITGLLSFFAILMLNYDSNNTSLTGHITELQELSNTNSILSKLLVSASFIISGLPFFFYFFLKSDYVLLLLTIDFMWVAIIVLSIGVISCYNYIQIVKKLIYNESKRVIFLKSYWLDVFIIILLQLISLLFIFMIF